MDAKIKIAEAFSQGEYASFLEYCNVCNYIFLDELTSVDFVAFKAKYNADVSFVKQLKRNVYDFESGVIPLHQDGIPKPVALEAAATFSTDEKVDLLSDDNGTFNSIIEGKPHYEEENSDFTITNDKVKFTATVEKVMVGTLEPLLDSVHPVSKAYDRVPWVDSIHGLNLSARATNALIKGGIKTVLQLLELDREKLSQIRNLGAKSIDEILAKIVELERQHFSVSLVDDFDSAKGKIFLSPECRSIIETILLGENDDGARKNLSSEEQKIVKNVVNAIDCIGCEFSLEIYTNSSRVIPLIASLEEFSTAYEREKKLFEVYDLIPYYRRSYMLSNYIKAFTSTGAKTAHAVLKPFLQPQIKVSDLKKLFSEVCKEKNSEAAMSVLLQLLQTDFRQVLTTALGNMIPKYEKPFSILCRRCAGLSLESIAIEFGLTRERIRQIEKKAMTVLHANIAQTGIDPLMFICADRNGDTVLTIQEITDYIGDSSKTELFKYFLQKYNSSNSFVYDSDRKLFHLKNMVYNADRVEQFVSDLPQIIFCNKLATLLSSVSSQVGVPLEILQTEFKRKYSFSGQVWYRGRLTVSLMCEVILKTYYPAGIKLYDEDEENRFREKVKEVFGNVKFSNNIRAFCARLADVAVLCDRGMYIHPSYIQIPDGLVQKIDDYISGSERIAISFHELFERFKEELLLSSNVSNHYFLQGILHYRLKDKYYFTRDLISKEKDAKFGAELEVFIRERGEVHKNEILSEFPGISDIMLSMKVNGSKSIIGLDNGQYMHSDLLNLQEEDYTIREIIETEAKNLPVSSRKLLDLLWITHADFLTRNEVSTHSKLFGILQYMFEDEFSFSRPYIAKLGTTDEITNLTVIKQHLQDYDRLSVSELMGICTENHLQFLSIRGLIRQLNNDFLRINSEMLIRIDDSVLTDETLHEIENMILEGFSCKGYIVASRIDNYIFYPDIGVSWNAFLLRSIVEKYFSEEIRIVDMPTTDTFAMNTVFVDPTMDVDNYEDLLRSVLKSEHNRDPFLSIDDVLNWLQGEKLILGEPPKCLTDGRVVCRDEYREIIIK
ncbi:DNA-directed RNA polymerase subunit alpha C-terminal domain-containing protein [Sporomusa acidovorans]|uniref:DNA-directed RNA polymerase subunit alpha n=1 Tax=Sporomusa acidovorans (strain ATCC 49682 / DSM 3132 / Mol) TaxID=1123286 RepID=A0ABZ3J2K6_SPOA4|nr:DNA-directed RNA polymerase subunit alpha C-terminal domain-containing protein [Sporomusa acidovorans]OZC13664.1 DNA-directed RNA polymerase subunit alpha [Sporomusa acidovorans DSM 3132]SDE85803.1 Sigma-70, region 4 [Sporomusa acidovorans]